MLQLFKDAVYSVMTWHKNTVTLWKGGLANCSVFCKVAVVGMVLQSSPISPSPSHEGSDPSSRREKQGL